MYYTYTNPNGFINIENLNISDLNMIGGRKKHKKPKATAAPTSSDKSLTTTPTNSDKSPTTAQTSSDKSPTTAPTKKKHHKSHDSRSIFMIIIDFFRHFYLTR
jgi:hypothetical protein